MPNSRVRFRESCASTHRVSSCGVVDVARKLVADELITEARQATGLERFDSESFREGLEILLGDVSRGEERPEPLLQRPVRSYTLSALASMVGIFS